MRHGRLHELTVAVGLPPGQSERSVSRVALTTGRRGGLQSPA
jgi:hypothetical protein